MKCDLGTDLGWGGGSVAEVANGSCLRAPLPRDAAHLCLLGVLGH